MPQVKINFFVLTAIKQMSYKGPFNCSQGLRAVIAESYERIHRSNLVGMGIVPLQYVEGQNADTLGLTGKEKYTIKIPEDIRPLQELTVKVRYSYYLLQSWLYTYAFC